MPLFDINASMGEFVDRILSTSMCNCSPTFPNHQDDEDDDCPETEMVASTSVNDIELMQPTSPKVVTPTKQNITKPPLNPNKKPRIINQHKLVGLSISIPSLMASPNQQQQQHSLLLPLGHSENNNPILPIRIPCSRNVDLRRKSLSEKYFFRPVSTDEDSVMGGGKKKQTM
jgi:hypothetical protein